MPKTQPDVSTLKAAQERLAELNLEEAAILADILDDAMAKMDAMVARYADVPQFRPDAVNQAINHRENSRMLRQHLANVLAQIAVPETLMPPLPAVD